MATTLVRQGSALLASLLLAALLLPAGVAGAQVPAIPNPTKAPADLRLEVLSTETQDPSAIDVAPDGRVIWAERTGQVKVLTPGGPAVLAGRLPVAANECPDCPEDVNEGGLHGLLL